MKKIKLVRIYGALPVLTKKISTRLTLPGQHGNKPRKKSSQYGIRLIEKQKLRHNYLLKEKQFVRYVEAAKRSKQLTGNALLQFLENRLDTSVYRCGLAPTIAAARQLVTHRHIKLNGEIINLPSYQCKNNDIIVQTKISRSAQQNSGAPVQLGPISVSCTHFNRPPIELDLKERLVVEFYSRQ